MAFTSGCNHPSFTLPWRTLLPYLVALHLLQPGSAQLTVVAPSLRVTANVGQDVVLRCHLSPRKDARNLDIRWILQRSSRLVHHYRNGVDLDQMLEYEGRTELLRKGLSDGNLDLRITAVTSSDSGSYSCAVQDGDAYADAVVELEVSDLFSQITNPWKVALAVIVTLLVGSFVIIAFLYRKKAAQSRELMDQAAVLERKDAMLVDQAAALERKDAMLVEKAAALERKDAELAELKEISGLSAENLKKLASKLMKQMEKLDIRNSLLKKDSEEMGSGVADLKKLARELEKHRTLTWLWNAKLNNLADKLEKQHSQFQGNFQHMDSRAVKQKELVTKLEDHCERMVRRNVKLEAAAVKVGQQAKESEERHEEMAEQTEAVVVETEE